MTSGLQPTSASGMRQTAERLRDVLTDHSHARSLVVPFTDPARTIWRYWPREMSDDTYTGIRLADLSPSQRTAVMKLVATVADQATLAQVAAIMALDVPLDHSEGYYRSELRSPDRYWIALFGNPSETGRWGWQFEGHHVSLNVVVEDDRLVSSTPYFLGANPARIERGDHVVTRPCAAEEDAGRRLVTGLTPDERKLAILESAAPIDVLTDVLVDVPTVVGPGLHQHPLTIMVDELVAMAPSDREALTFDLGHPAGIRRQDLGDRGRHAFDDLLEVFLGRLPAGIGAVQRDRLEPTLDDIAFAWAGSTEPGAPHYYRLHGPSLLIEYDCVQDNANHIHTVWRDPTRDFGLDPLRRHHQTDHQNPAFYHLTAGHSPL